MTINSQPVDVPARRVASEPGEGQAWWFLGTLAVLRNPEGAPRTPVVMELTIPPGGSPPRHVHETLDDSFFLLAGEVVVCCGTETFVVQPGGYVAMPRGVEHTFRVTSHVPARMLLVHADDSFLRFVEAVGTPTSDHRLPSSGEVAVELDLIARLSAEHGVPIIGPSLEEDEARSYTGVERSRLGAVHHLSLHVTDLAASERWYVDAFEMVRIDGEIAEDGTGHLVLAQPDGGCLITLMSSVRPKVEHVAFTCADRGALVRWQDELASRGVTPGSVTDAPYGSGFVVRDPDGMELELFAPASPGG